MVSSIQAPLAAATSPPCKAGESFDGQDEQSHQQSRDVENEDSSSSSSDSSSSDSSEHPDPLLRPLISWAAGPGALALRSKTVAFSGERVLRLRLKTLPAVHKDEQSKLACGR